MTKKTSPAYRASKEETIPINKLHPFSNHPFHIRHDLEFSELVDSISESGIITPIIVRPKVGVGYEVIADIAGGRLVKNSASKVSLPEWNT